MKHETCRDRRTSITAMQRDQIAKALHAAKDGKRHIQPGARRIGIEKAASEQQFGSGAEK